MVIQTLVLLAFSSPVLPKWIPTQVVSNNVMARQRWLELLFPAEQL